MNYMSPDHEIYTYELGWIRIDYLHQNFRLGNIFHIAEFNPKTFDIKYTNEYDTHDRKLTYCMYELKDTKLNYNQSVYKENYTLISQNGEDLFTVDMKSIRKALNNEAEFYFINLDTIRKGTKDFIKDYLIPSNDVTLRLQKYNNGIMYAVKTKTGIVPTRREGIITFI